jgi:capsular polysaccharide biosynthesis protein
MPPTDETRAAETWLSQPWRTIRPHLLPVVIIVAITTLAAAVMTAREPTRYATSTTFVVNSAASGTNTETLVRTLAALLRSPAVGSDVRDKTQVGLTPRAIARRISVSRPPGSGVLNVSVTDTDRRRSLRIAEALPQVFTGRIDQQLRAATDATDGAFELVSWDPDVFNTQTIPAPVGRNTALGFVLGLGLAALGVALRETRAPHLHSSGQVYQAFDLPLVAALPSLEQSVRSRWNVVDTVQGILAGSAAVGWPEHPHTIVVTGPESHPTRASMALAVATTIAVSGAHVVLVDADIERTELTRLLGARRRPGLKDFLQRGAAARDVITPLTLSSLPSWLGVGDSVKGSLDFLPAGSAKSDPGALGSIRVAGLLASLRGSAVIVIDAPRVPGPVPVSRLLESADAVLAVAIDGATRAPGARSAASVLRALASPAAVAILLDTGRFEVAAPGPPPAAEPAPGDLQILPRG